MIVIIIFFIVEYYERKVKMLALYEVVLRLSNGPDKKERTICNEGANFTIVSTTLLIGLNIKC